MPIPKFDMVSRDQYALLGSVIDDIVERQRLIHNCSHNVMIAALEDALDKMKARAVAAKLQTANDG